MATFDVLLRGGVVIDGTGGPARRADVGVVGARIEPLATCRRLTLRRSSSSSIGIDHVFVNGRPAILDGVETGERPGRLLRKA